MSTVPARRGRKPKAQKVETLEEVTSAPKRGRKPRQIAAYDSINNDEPLISDDENIVLKLDIVQPITAGDIEQPDAYTASDSFLSRPYEIEDELDVFDHKSPCGNRVVELLKDFEKKNMQNEWPSTTSIHCYWCCHKFNNTPFGIPVKYTGDKKFHVFGCFCSLECSAAYNMTHYESVDDMWERYMLLNMLSQHLGQKRTVKPAPSRLALKAFGGHMEIDEFRVYCETSKVLNTNFPPMMTLTQQLEEINDTDISSEMQYIPIDTERINRYKEKLKLKRAKPVTNYKNTLDHAMNLKFAI
jgi:hypothetical protein